MKVQATDVSKRYKLKIKELGRIANPGEVFEVTRDRFVVLNGANQFKSVFVTRYIEPETDKQEAKAEEVKTEVQVKNNQLIRKSSLKSVVEKRKNL